MSFNLRFADAPDGDNRWELRHGLLLRTIKAFAPDVLATQECLSSQRAHLCSHLVGYESVGVGRDDGDESGEMVAILYRQHRFKQVDAGHFWLSETPMLAGSRSWDSSAARMCTWVCLAPHTNPDLCFMVFNTHLDVHSSTARERGAELLRDRVAEISTTSRIIVLGDFNSPPTSKVHHTLVHGSNGKADSWCDTYQLFHADVCDTECGTTHDFSGRRDQGRIDWILVSSDITPLEADIDHTNDRGRYPSDHFPVTALLRLAHRSL